MINKSDVAAVEVRDLTVGYGTEIIQQDLNFRIMPGEIFVILGGSGCGKSTLLKHLIGLNRPMRGEIFIHGQSLNKAEGLEKRKIMQCFGVLYQSGALFGSLTLEENISLQLQEYTDLNQNLIQSVVKEKLSLVGLAEYGKYLPSEISGGMKKRAGLARAMAMDADLLFFDEPSAGLDPLSAAHLDKLILRLREDLGTTMVIVTHELDSIFTIADRVIMLDAEQKRIIAEGDPYDLRDHSELPEVRKFLSREGLTRD